MNKDNNSSIGVDSSDQKNQGGGSEINKILTKEIENEYPNASEDIGSNIPDLLADEMNITMFVDSYHAHDKVKIRSITIIIIFLGSNLWSYYSKR